MLSFRNARTLILILLVTSGFSIFSGGILVTCGGGAIFSPLFDIAKPIFSSDATEVLTITEYPSGKQGQTDGGISHFIVDKQGHRHDISLLIRFCASLIYSFIVMIISSGIILTLISLGKIPIDPVYYTMNPPGYRRHDGPVLRAMVANAWITAGLAGLIIGVGLIRGIIYFAASLKYVL